MSECSAKGIIKKLLDYKYKFFDENVEDSCSVDNPIVIMPPTDAEMSLLRVYAFGGCIGYVSIFDKGSKIAKIKEYDKYLIDGYMNGYNHIFVLNKDLKSKYIDKDADEEKNRTCVCNALNTIVTKKILPDALICDDEYLDLIVSAAYTRFLHREGGVATPLAAQERSRQMCIAKSSTQSKYCDNALLVVDVEFDIDLKNDQYEPIYHYSKSSKKWNENRKAKVDFVVFDGSSFGLVEFKYLGDSMKADSENSLKNHYIDFKRILVEDKNNLEILWNAICERASCLFEYDVVKDPKWKDLFERAKNNGYKEDLIWCGFYFMGDKNSTKFKKGCADIEGEVKKQLSEFFVEGAEHPIVKYCKTDINDNSFVMTRDIREIMV